MKFLLDENADYRLAGFLTQHGHDVATVVIDYSQRTLDPDLLALARVEGRTIITNDLDFGALVIREQLPPRRPARPLHRCHGDHHPYPAPVIDRCPRALRR